MNFLKRFFRKPVVEKTVVVKQAHQISLEEWRSTPNLVTQAQALMKNPTFLAMLVVMREESPVSYLSNTEGANANADLQTLGRIRGYHMALNNLEKFSQPLEQIEQLEATFGAEKEENNE